MSSNEELDDLEEGEISENSHSFDSPFSINFTKNETKVTTNADEISPIFQTLFSQNTDPLFGSSDTDLRVNRQTNVFNDCDERLNQTTNALNVGFNEINETNPSFVGQNVQNMNPMTSRPQLNESNYRPLKDNNFNYFDSRTNTSLHSPSFRVPESQIPVRMRPQVRALLPTPVFPVPQRPSIQTYPQICAPLIPRFGLATDPLISSVDLNQTSIPFICEPIVTQNETKIQSEIKSKELNIPKTVNSKNSNEINVETIELTLSDDIQEVQMQVSDSDEPYDPEQDILIISPPVSPPFKSPFSTPEKSSSKRTKNSKVVSNELMAEKHLENSKQKRITVKPHDYERNARFNRLIISSNSVEQTQSSGRKRRAKPPKKESIRMTPKRAPKFIDTMQPISSSAKNFIHNKCSKKGHKSRRKTKRIAKQKVITKYLPQNNRNDMKETSYEDLLEEYKRIQRELKDLEIEENSKSLVDRQEKEKIENLFRSEDISEISNESRIDLSISEDDDENELRRLALESKKRRELKILEEVTQKEEEDEDILRQQLLESLKTKLKSNLHSNETNKAMTQTLEENVDNSLEQIIKIQSTSDNNNESEVQIKNQENNKMDALETIIPPKPIPKLIIHFGDDSTDEELEMHKNLSKRSVPLGLESFIKQARLRSEPKAHSTHSIPVLTVTKQKELEKLKAEIVRRERIQISDKMLKQNENQLKSAKERLNEKLSKQNLLKTRVRQKQTALRKAQIHVRKMQEAFRAATRLVSSTASEFHSFNNEMKNIEKDVKQELQNVHKFENECKRVGSKLYGNTYKLPIIATLKRSNSTSVSVTPNKKKLKTEKSSSLSKGEIANEKKRLVEELKNCHKLLSLKKANLRPSSPQILQLKSFKTIEVNNEKSIDSQQVLKNLAKDLLNTSSTNYIISLNCFIEKMFLNKNSNPLNLNIRIPESDSNLMIDYKNNYLDDSYDSVLFHLHSYRLIESQSIPISCDLWTNNVNPLQEICKFDLLGTCKDIKCLGQHFDKFLLDPYNKIVDLLLYEPKLGGITSEIPEKMDLELFAAIKQKLLQFAQKLIDSNPKIPLETHCRKIAEQIRKRSNESVVCFLNRRIPKLFDISRIEVPFDDLMYRFNIKDKNLIINQTMISELKLSADPDIGFKNRFFAPEGVPISAQLETSLAADPHNIQLWIKLAYYHISRSSDHNFADSVDNALNVLSRALDHNRSEPELYEHYLFVYSNRVVRKGEDSKFDLFNICRKVVEHCPHYRVRKCVLSLCVDFNDKIKVSTEIINDLLKISDSKHKDFETLSHQILEIFFYKIRLNLEQNNIKQSILEFNRALKESFVEEKVESQSPHIGNALTATDRIFAWLCFTYLLIHNNVPNHCFELLNQGFPRLINKNLFVFDWNSLKNKISLNEMKEHLKKAIDFCDLSLEDSTTLVLNHFGIHLNYAELCLVKENDQKYYEYLMKLTENNSVVWPSIVEQIFKSNENLNLIQIFKNSCIYCSEDIRIRLNVAKHYHKINQLSDARNELFLIVSKHYVCLICDNYLVKAFETLLFEDDENNHNFELINNRKSKESDSPIIWLSYILLLEIENSSVREIDSAFQTALALCSIDKTDPKDLQLLWSNYLEYCVQNLKTPKQLMDLFESVRHCCLTITDTTFQSQVIRFFCRLISVNEKSKALIEFAKLIPQNLDIILTAINFGLRNNKRENVWVLINTIVFDKNIRFKSLQFWKIAIGLAIDRNDHLSVHKFFQISICLMPYNSILWQYFKTYETNIKHIEHLKQGKHICENQLKICHF